MPRAGERSSPALKVLPRPAGVFAQPAVFNLPGRVVGVSRDERTDELFLLDDLSQVHALDLSSGKARRLRTLAGGSTRLVLGAAVAVCR